MRILRHLLMLLAMLSLVGHPASAAPGMHGRAVMQHTSHHHHDADASGAGHDAAAVEHGHHCPGHHHDGKCCESACCASNCLSVAFEAVLGRSAHLATVKVRVPVGDSRPDGTIPFLPDRPPITT